MSICTAGDADRRRRRARRREGCAGLPGAPRPRPRPLAQKMAAEAGVDLRTLTGTGPGGQDHQGRCRSGDARAGSRRGVQTRWREASVGETKCPAPPLPSVPPLPLPVADVAERIPLKGVRGIIADRMGTSVHTTARVTLMMEVDATEFVAMPRAAQGQGVRRMGLRARLQRPAGEDRRDRRCASSRT